MASKIMAANYLFLIIVLYSFGVDCQYHNYISYSQEQFQETISPQELSEQNLTMQWINTEAAIRKAYFNLGKLLLPTGFQLAANSNISVNCTRSLTKFMFGMMNMKSWAIRMFDSWDKISHGVMTGKAAYIGNYDQCLETDVPSHEFQGKFCFIQLSMILPERSLSIDKEDPIPLFEGVFEPGTAIHHLADQRGWLYLAHPRYGICLPSTCSKDDVKLIAASFFRDAKAEGDLAVLSCDTKKDLIKDFTSGEISITLLFCTLISLVVIGTIADLYQRANSNDKVQIEKKSTAFKCILCFSAYTNFLGLIKKDTNPDTIKVFHGLRVISVLWVILGHSYFPVNYHPLEKAFHSKDISKGYLMQITLGFLAVDNFMFISSALLAYSFLRLRGKINIFMIFAKRYIRLTPTMMLVVAFFALSEKYGSGPLWKEVVGDVLSKNCKERGWLNLLYINNIMYSPEVCLGWTWYLSADTQLFLVCLFILNIMRRKTSNGFLTIGVLMIICTMVNAFCHVYYKLPPTYLQSFINFKYWYYFGSKGYVNINYHLPVSCMGLITGYLLLTKKCRIPKTLNIVGWILSFAVFISLNLLTHHWNQGVLPSSFVSALHGSTHRIIYAFTLTFVSLSCCWGGGGFVNSFLSWEGFVPLSRITYMVYLIHYGLVYFYYGYLRQSVDFSHRTLSTVFLSNIAASFIVAFFLDLVFEMPIIALSKLFCGDQVKKQKVSAASMLEVNTKAKQAA